MKILIVNGPNLNMLGTREPEVYGHETLEQLERLWTRVGARLGIEIETFQSNHEGAIIDAIQGARGSVDALIINAGAYSHTSYAIHDAIIATSIRTVEVHISNIHERESWRNHSVLSPVADLVIVGRGSAGYIDAIRYLHAQMAVPPTRFRYDDHDDAILDLRVPDGDGVHPVAVLVHGGYWRDIWLRDTLDQMSAALVSHGFATANIEYRRGAGSFPAGHDDVDAAIDWIRTNATDHDLDPAAIVLVGHSAGGYHVLHAAQRRDDIAGVIALASVTDLRATARALAHETPTDPVTSFLGVTEEEGPEVWAAAALAGKPKVPVHIIHGSDDDVVDITHARGYDTGGDGGHVVTELDGVDHSQIIDPDHDAFSSIVDALNRVRQGP